MARWRTWGSLLLLLESEDDDDGRAGKGVVGFAGKGSSRVWLRATVEKPREWAVVRVWRRRSVGVAGDQAMLRS